MGERGTVSFTDLPVSQGARDLLVALRGQIHELDHRVGMQKALTILAAADEKDVRSLLWARRVGKL